MKDKFTVCVFCGSSTGNSAIFRQTAFQIGLALGNAGYDIVYGGGSNGLMGRVADGAISAGPEVTGVIPIFLKDVEAGHTGITRLIVTDDMHTRKRIMYEKADIFLALPGGIGTFDETIEVLTWLQLNVLNKNLILFNLKSYWNSFIRMIEDSTAAGFYSPRNPDAFSVVDTTADLVLKINNYQEKYSK